ncbi:LacI family DNA-binding transcriptional regulator [Microbacterium sp. ASV49]|uniref:LacI family DNA-binding transcriptional regulator n=1 Tax=Microbacterium candidum TaxID=3041922 RepID=A0ABT7MW72_9MICO|nr:LacI family DNA-binding transcriptional regulator [Microbacterium sp. ASV49]MDL9978701.1 LacI family DNA-binding transcriptional regulator [Microbacterium sp. ASV49]
MSTSHRRSTGRVTITDIAERAGVSIGAVSFALNGRKGVSEKTRERVLAVADELGWAPASAARSLAEAKTDTVGLVLARDPHNLGVESFYMQFLAGMETELSRRGYGLLLQVVPDGDRELATLRGWGRSHRVDGVLLVDLRVDDPRVGLFALDGSLPAVAVGDPSVAPGLTTVWTDDATSMREAVRYLAGLGHRRIARVSGLAALAHTRIRDDAFAAEMRARGLQPVLMRTDYSAESGAAATRSALDSPDRPTAFIFDNDIMAVAGLSVALERGLSVPEDVSMIAWDDSVLCAHTFPTLTALSHDVVAFGAHATRRLFDVIEGAAPAPHLDSTPSIQVRASTGPAPE